MVRNEWKFVIAEVTTHPLHELPILQ